MHLLTPGPVGGGAAQDAARTELAKPEYHLDDPSLTQRIVDKVTGWLGRVLDGAVHGGVLNVLLIAICVAAVVAVVLLGRRAGSLRRQARSTGPGLLTPSAQVDHRRAAERFATEGKYALALREWLRDCAATVESRGLLEPRPGRTGAELARTAGRRLPDAAEDLHRAAVAFDEVWFGGRPALAADADAGRVAADAVRGARTRVVDAPAPSYAVPT